MSKVLNPLIKNPRSWRRQFNQWLCNKFGCIQIGPYYGMPQSHCRRCGHINKYIASSDCEEWDEPWGEYK